MPQLVTQVEETPPIVACQGLLLRIQVRYVLHLPVQPSFGGLGYRAAGGQFQRALFARMIVQDAPVLLLDEPFTAVDERTAADLLNLVLGWHAAGKTVIAVLHDLQLIERAFPETLLLAGVPIAWGPTAACLTPANIGRARLGMSLWDDDTAAEPVLLRRPAA